MVPRNRAGDTGADTAGISLAEHLLVWSWRKIATGRADCPLIAWEFKRFCGEDAAEVLATLCAFLRALAYAGRRRLQIGYPGCAVLTADERQCLLLIAAAQTGDEVRFDAHLRWLARAGFSPRYLFRPVRLERPSTCMTFNCRGPCWSRQIWAGALQSATEMAWIACLPGPVWRRPAGNRSHGA